MPPRSTAECDQVSLDYDPGCSDSGMKQETQPLAVPKKTVTFAPTAKVRQVAKMTKEQAKDIWFVANDFVQMKKQFAPTVQRWADGKLTQEEMNGEDHCVRGLEYRTKDGARKRMQNKFNGISSVLHEQDRQLFEENVDPERLARVYMEANAQCMVEAMELGAQDALDIQDYLRSDENAYDVDPDLDGSIRSTSTRGGFDSSNHSTSSSKSWTKRSKKFEGAFSGTSSWKGPSTNSSFSLRGLRRVLSGGKKARNNSMA